MMITLLNLPSARIRAWDGDLVDEPRTRACLRMQPRYPGDASVTVGVLRNFTSERIGF